MGFGLPAAIGAKVAAPNKIVVKLLSCKSGIAEHGKVVVIEPEFHPTLDHHAVCSNNYSASELTKQFATPSPAAGNITELRKTGIAEGNYISQLMASQVFTPSPSESHWFV